jgi:methylenetetrahydrofolate reductase (NADPH)
MHIKEILEARRTTFSFEFFPPKTDRASHELFATIAELQALNPSFVSVTYGAGGSTRERTHDLIVRIQKETKLTAVSHLTCVCHSQEEIGAILDRYAESRIENVLALGGDPPRTIANHDRAKDGFQYADQLVAYIRERTAGLAGGKGFGIGVAGFPEGHPATPNRLKELDYLKRKVDAGADYICTQLFFNNPDFYDFRERCELAGIHVPILAGIMPITSNENLERMAELALGTRFPAKLLRAIARCDGHAAAVSSVGIHWAAEQCRDLLDNQVRGIHFYTLNRSDATRQIYESLGLSRT